MNTPTLPSAAPVPGSLFAVTAATTASCSAFVGHRLVAQGSYADITAALSGYDLAGDTVLVFDDATSALLDVPSGGAARPQAPGPQLAGHAATPVTTPPATASAHTASADAAPADATPAEASPTDATLAEVKLAVASPQDAAHRISARKDVATQKAATQQTASQEVVSQKVVSQEAVPAPPAVGRPKLGVVAREVTLLPRHWEWLATQSGGASAALRRLVEEARRTHAARDRQRAAKDRTFRFLNAVAGNLAGFEEAARLLYADDAAAFASHLETWPTDVRQHALQLAVGAFGSDEPPQP